MSSEINQATEPRTRRFAWVDLAALLSGMGVGIGLARSALATTKLDWRLDRDLAVMVCLLLVPPGIAWVMLPWLLARRRAIWSVEMGLWLAIAVCGLAWTEVWLDGGVRLGAGAKLVGGIGAYFLSPAVGIGSLVVAAWSLIRGPRNVAWSLWLAVALGLTLGAGWIMFLAVMLPLRF